MVHRASQSPMRSLRNKACEKNDANGKFRFMIHCLGWLFLFVPSFAIRPSLIKSQTTSTSVGPFVNLETLQFLRTSNIYHIKVDNGNSSYVKTQQDANGLGQVFRWRFDTEMKESSVDEYIAFLNRRHYHLTSERDESESELRFYLRKWRSRRSQESESSLLRDPLALESPPSVNRKPDKLSQRRPSGFVRAFLATVQANCRTLTRFWLDQIQLTTHFVKLIRQRLSGLFLKSLQRNH